MGNKIEVIIINTKQNHSTFPATLIQIWLICFKNNNVFKETRHKIQTQ